MGVDDSNFIDGLFNSSVTPRIPLYRITIFLYLEQDINLTVASCEAVIRQKLLKMDLIFNFISF